MSDNGVTIELLDAIQDAHRFLESNDQIGKVVVTV